MSKASTYKQDILLDSAKPSAHCQILFFLPESTPSLLVVGGFDDGDFLDVAEVVNLGSNPSCILPSYPGERKGLSGSVLGGEIVVCGGHKFFDSDVMRYRDCYNYSPQDDVWTETTPLRDFGRAGAAGILLNDSVWWLTGGFYDGAFMNSELKFAGGGEGQYYLDLPSSMSYHNFFRINSTHAVLTGGVALTRSVYMVNSEIEEFTRLPDIPEENYRFQAGLVTFPNGTKMVVVAGGVKENYCYGLDLDSMTWIGLPQLPIRVAYAQAVQSESSFYVVGGVSLGASLDSIFEFDVNQGIWRELPQKLSVPRHDTAAVLVPHGVIGCDSLPRQKSWKDEYKDKMH